MRKSTLSLAIIALALPFLAAAPAQAQDPRTWVSGTGDDANPCSRTAPCKTFVGAIQKTAPGGEINCLDPGQFGGQVTISFSLTISCQAGTAGILMTNDTHAIFINAATTDVVTLRGLDLDGQGTGFSGIFVQSAKAVYVQNCTIRNFRSHDFSAGIETQNSTTVFFHVADTVISDNTNGLFLLSHGGFKVASLKNVVITGSRLNGLALLSSDMYANVTKSVISGNGFSAVSAGAGATVNIDRSTLANNATGLNAGGNGAVIRASGNNIFNNTTGFNIAGGAFIQSDGTNNTGGSNGGGAPNASLTKQ